MGARRTCGVSGQGPRFFMGCHGSQLSEMSGSGLGVREPPGQGMVG